MLDYVSFFLSEHQNKNAHIIIAVLLMTALPARLAHCFCFSLHTSKYNFYTRIPPY